MKKRYGAPIAGAEKGVLVGYLDHYREVILELCNGLGREDLVRIDPDAGYSLLGLIKHLTLAERTWFEERTAGEPFGFEWDPEDPNSDFRIEEHEQTEDILDMYRSSSRRAREIVESMSLDDHLRGSDYTDYNLRWVMLNMIVETARHAGHADQLRERLDGRTGVGYPGYAT